MKDKGVFRLFNKTISYGKFCNAFLFFGLLTTIGGSCASNLRLMPSGLSISPIGGYPFLYEYGIMIILFAFFLRLCKGFQRPSILQVRIIAGILLFYIPIFTIYFIGSGDLTHFFGGGQLRLQLEVFLLGIILCLYPVDKSRIENILFFIALAALLNGLVAIFSFYGIVNPIYMNAWRTFGRIRYSGLFDMPASLGFVAAAAIAYTMWPLSNKLIRSIVFSICLFSIILADSRTAMVTTGVLLFARFLTYSRISMSLSLLLLLFLPFIYIFSPLSIVSLLLETDLTRLESLKSSGFLFKSFPFGIPWGTFTSYNPYPGAVSPHNWPAVSLLYGGVFSFLAVAIFHVYIFKLFFSIKDISRNSGPLMPTMIFILIALTCSAWLEQAFQTAFPSLTFIIILATLSHSYSEPLAFTRINTNTSDSSI